MTTPTDWPTGITAHTSRMVVVEFAWPADDVPPVRHLVNPATAAKPTSRVRQRARRGDDAPGAAT
jgi:hypothetical protein